MTPTPASDSTAETLLETLDPEVIADEQVRHTIKLLLNLVEQLKSQVKDLQDENQRLRDENNRLKGELALPDIKPNRAAGGKSNHCSERERRKPQAPQKGSKNQHLKIDREQVLAVPFEQLPADAEFKGYEEVIIQDVKLTTDNVLFRKEKYYSSGSGRTYLADLPAGYEGQFGPGVKALVVSLYFQGNMTQGKLLEFLSDIGISISVGQLSNLLIKGHQAFHTEKQKVYQAGLASSPWQHLDQTSARVGVTMNPDILTAPSSILISRLSTRGVNKCYNDICINTDAGGPARKIRRNPQHHNYLTHRQITYSVS